MKIKDYTPKRPIILGDLGLDNIPRKFPKLSEEEIMAMQPASTQTLMKMAPDEPFITEIDPVAVRLAKTTAEFVGERPVTAELVEKVERHRRSSNKFKGAFYKADKTPIISDDNVNGDYEKSGMSEETRDKAIQAFCYSPPAEVTKEEVQRKAIGLVEYKSEPIITEWRGLNWYQAMWHKIWGNEIVSREEKPKTWRDK